MYKCYLQYNCATHYDSLEVIFDVPGCEATLGAICATVDCDLPSAAGAEAEAQVDEVVAVADVVLGADTCSGLLLSRTLTGLNAVINFFNWSAVGRWCGSKLRALFKMSCTP